MSPQGVPLSERIGILQVTDSLEMGGAERVALNFANLLPRDRFQTHLCATRWEGPLAAEIAPDVGRIVLGRVRRWDDPGAARRLARYVREHDIRLLHCHKDTIFLASLARVLGMRARLLWHDHWGLTGVRERPAWLYRAGTFCADGVIAVNQDLRRWSEQALRHRPDRVWYVPNFVAQPRPCPAPPELPGKPGARIVCVARLDPQKDIVNLARAMERVVREMPEACALVLGGETDPEYGSLVRREIARLGVGGSVRLLGTRNDVTDVIQNCDIGVLSSAAEGLPLALIEYGLCKVPSVATRVGQCPDVLDGGKAGILVPPGDHEALAAGLLRLLRAPEERARLAGLAHRYAMAHHSESAVLGRVVSIYETLLATS